MLKLPIRNQGLSLSYLHSVNEEVVHGVASLRRTVLAEMLYHLMWLCVTRATLEIMPELLLLILFPRRLPFSCRPLAKLFTMVSLLQKVGNRIGQISNAIQQYIESRNLKHCT